MLPGSGDPAGTVGPTAGYVLVVAPDAGARTLLETTLQRAGFDVMAASEAETLAACDLKPPRLVVVDVPGAQSAFTALQRLAAHPPLAQAPLVALAEDGTVERLTGAVLRGAATCLRRPVEPEALVTAATRLIEWSPPPPDRDTRRRHRRPLLLDVEVTERETGRQVAGQMVEASSGGCRLDMPVLLEPGHKVRIVLCAGGEATRVALGGEVRWAQKRDDGRGAAGVEFNGSTTLVAARVLGLVDELDAPAS